VGKGRLREAGGKRVWPVWRAGLVKRGEGSALEGVAALRGEVGVAEKGKKGPRRLRELGFVGKCSFEEA